MRNPRHWRNLALAVLASSLLALLLPWMLPPEAAGDGLRGGLFLYGLIALFGGGFTFVSAHRDLRAKEALARGEDVIARWRLSPDEWRAFLALNRQRGATDDTPNELVSREGIPPEGVEVIIGQEAVQVDGSIHRIPLRGTPEVLRADLQDNEGAGAPATIELHLKYEGGARASGGPRPPTYTRLRFPLPGPAWRDARRVVAHFNRDLPGKADFFHGRGDGSDPEDLSKCWSCGFETYKFRSQCERCGASLQSRRWSRRFGLVLVLCGLFITGLMSVVLYFTMPMLMNPGVSMGGSRFSGSPAMAFGVSLVLGAVWAFGATALGYGLWQMATGKRSLKVVKLLLGVFSGLLALAYFL
jgi:hypothetical protein